MKNLIPAGMAVAAMVVGFCDGGPKPEPCPPVDIFVKPEEAKKIAAEREAAARPKFVAPESPPAVAAAEPSVADLTRRVEALENKIAGGRLTVVGPDDGFRVTVHGTKSLAGVWVGPNDYKSGQVAVYQDAITGPVVGLYTPAKWQGKAAAANQGMDLALSVWNGRPAVQFRTRDGRIESFDLEDVYDAIRVVKGMAGNGVMNPVPPAAMRPFHTPHDWRR